MSFLKISNLSVDYKMRRETVHAAKNVNIEVSKGEILGLVGESGSGKSTVGNAIINLIDEPGKVSNGTIFLGDINVHKDPENIVNYRGNKIGLIFQDPQTSLNPIFTIGEQLIETIQTHLNLRLEEAKSSFLKAIEINNQNHDAYINLSNIYILENKNDLCLEILFKYLSDNGFNSLIANHIGKICLNYNNTKQLNLDRSLKILNTIDKFEENEDVQQVFHNLNITSEIINVEEIELDFIDYGVEEVFEDEDGILLYASFEFFGKIQFKF